MKRSMHPSYRQALRLLFQFPASFVPPLGGRRRRRAPRQHGEQERRVLVDDRLVLHIVGRPQRTRGGGFSQADDQENQHEACGHAAASGAGRRSHCFAGGDEERIESGNLAVS